MLADEFHHIFGQDVENQGGYKFEYYLYWHAQVTLEPLLDHDLILEDELRMNVLRDEDRHLL